jgi:hypothetical protein
MLHAVQRTAAGIQADRAEQFAQCSLVVAANKGLHSQLCAAEQREAASKEILQLQQKELAAGRAMVTALQRDLVAREDSINHLVASSISKDRCMDDIRAANAALAAEATRISERSFAAEGEAEVLREASASASTSLHAAVARLACADECSAVLSAERDMLTDRLRALTRQLRKEELRNAALHERCLVKEAQNAKLSLAARRSSLPSPLEGGSHPSPVATDQSPRPFFSSSVASLPRCVVGNTSDCSSPPDRSGEGEGLSPSPQMPHSSILAA